MTVSEMIQALQEIEARGYGNAEVKRFYDHYTHFLSDYIEIDGVYVSKTSDNAEVHVC